MNKKIPEKALILESIYLDCILRREKTWEMRSRNCKLRGPVGLIRKGAGQVVGVVEIVDVLGPFSPEQVLAHQAKHRIPVERLADPVVAKWNRAWVLENVQVLAAPVAYQHKQGAQTWVVLDESAKAGIAAQLDG